MRPCLADSLSPFDLYPRPKVLFHQQSLIEFYCASSLFVASRVKKSFKKERLGFEIVAGVLNFLPVLDLPLQGGKGKRRRTESAARQTLQVQRPRSPNLRMR